MGTAPDAAPDQALEDLWRGLAPQVLVALVRRTDDFGAAEDAVQEALLAAATQWPRDGVPTDPKAWLVRVASRRLVDQWRSDSARERRELVVARREPDDALVAPAADVEAERDDGDGDALALLLLCCHPALTPASQVALTLRAVGGLTTSEIARAFVVPEATMAQRISRAKRQIKDAGATFPALRDDERVERLAAVLHVLYLVFTEGHTATTGSDLQRVDLRREAVRLARAARELLPDDGEVAGLLALMLLTDARRGARVGPDGEVVPLAEQDRSRWDRAAIAEGLELVAWALRSTPLGPYQVQAAIAAVHDEAASAAKTDWRQVLGLYDVLLRLAPSPLVELNRAVARAEVDGPRAALDDVRALVDDGRLAEHHRLHSVRAHLLEQLDDLDGARDAYERAAALTTSEPEQRYLLARAARLR
ncbi:RNA polymerase sigma factor [Angustibacter peucedani]